MVILTCFLEFDIKLGTPGEVLQRYNIHVLADYSMCINLYRHPLSMNRFIFFEDLTCYLYHGCIGPAGIPTVRDVIFDLISVWTYPCLIVECLHVSSLLSLESVVLVDSLSFENTYWLFLYFYLFLSWLKANMFLN